MSPASRRSLGEIGLVLLGTWFAVEAFVQAGWALALLAEVPDDIGEVSAIQFLPLTTYVQCSAVLILFRRPISWKLFSESETDSVETAPHGESCQPFLISLLGIWVVLMAVAKTAEIEAGLFLAPSPGEFDALFGSNKPRELFSPEAWAARSPYHVPLVGGAVLFVSSGRISSLWAALRSAGRMK
jgi:hypothetical protein